MFVAPERTATDRFVIRSWMPGDGAAAAAAVSASYSHLRPFMAWAQAEQTVEQAEDYVRGCRAKYRVGEDFALGIFAPDERDLIGGCGYHLREGPVEEGSAEIGMWIRVERAGEGLGSAALEELVRWGFTDWPWERLVWRAATHNPASIRCAEKAGMVREGVHRSQWDPAQQRRRDTAVYASIKSDWT